jgi:glycosyltransferase involved in cell wall biosynthesis
MEYNGSGELRRVLLLERGGVINGAQRQLCYLACGLDRRRFEPIVFLGEPGPLGDDLTRNGIEVHVVRMRPWHTRLGALRRRLDALRIARLAERRRIDLVHASYLWTSGYMHLVSRRLGVPGVVHVRGPLSGQDVVRHGLARADAVIAIAQRYHEDLLAVGIAPDHVNVIDDAVDLELFRPAPAARNALRKQYGLEGRLLVGLVGRVEPGKRVIEFLEVIAPLTRPSDGQVSGLVIGQPGPDPYCRQVQQAAARLGLGGHVVFTGRREDMPAVIAELDILMTMSGGSVMFEAMACARPVLSVRTDGRHSVHTRHGETAWCVTTDHPEPVTAALALLAGDPDLRQRLGLAAQAWAQRHLSVATMVTRTQALYDRLLRR